jgi:16S rRNA (cytosine967-C5)-methyltransferase
MNKHNPRILAVQTLAKIKNGSYSNLQLNHVIGQHDLSDADKRLLTTLVYGVIQNRLTLEFWLTPFITGKKVQPWVRELLYTALYQWQYLDKIPQHAIFNESTEVAKTLGHVGVAKFITAILRRMEREGLPDTATITDPIARLSVETSLPEWLLAELNQQQGWDKTVRIAHSINHAPEQSIRVNHALVSDQQALEALENEGFTVRASQVAAHAYRASGGHVASSQAYQKGWITIQDESAMLPVESLRLDEAHLQVLDAAAAPGGKTTQIAAYLQTNQGHVTALDIHPHKVALIEQNAQRLQVADVVSAQALDAREVATLPGEFDRILVDAPCSGFGLLRRKPEIRYDKTLADVQNLARLQGEILSAVSQKLKNNGIMVYSTCTILQQENDDVVAQFLAQHPDFELIATQTAQNLTDNRNNDLLHIYPDDYQTDGFFIATLRKKATAS